MVAAERAEIQQRRFANLAAQAGVRHLVVLSQLAADDHSPGLLEDYAHYRRGEAAEISSAVAEVTGIPPRDVSQFAHDYAPAFGS